MDQSVGGAGFSAASWIIKAIAEGALGYIGKDCAGWLLSFVGGDDDGMKDAVDQMNQKLDQVIADLKVIEAKLEAVLKLIQMTTDDIKNIEQQFQIEEPQNVINNTYGNMKGVFTSDKIGDPTTKANVQDTMDDILSTARHDIDQQMFDIHAGIMGTTPGIGNGAMDAFTTTLVDHTGDGQLLTRYKALESYFERLVTVQAKGLSLMVEALHARDNPQAGSGMAPMAYEGTAKQWMDNKFTPYMEDEIEEFLRCTERLVLAECDLRTEVAVGGHFLPGDAAEIFERADFVAAQISPARHPFGAVARVIGEPNTVKSIIADHHVEANGQAMEVVKLGLDKQDVREVPVEVWNHWPGGYEHNYMEWAWATSHNISGFIEFSRTRHIAVAKLSLANAANATTYKVETTFPHETASGSLKTCKCEGDMSCVAAAPAADSDTTHIYGHATLPIRHRPREWYRYSHHEDCDDRIDSLADTRLSGSYPWARSRATLNTGSNWLSSWADFDIASGIALPLINGDDGKRRMTARTQMRSHRYGSMSLSVDSHSWLHLLWTGNSGEYSEWESSGGDPHIYGEVSPHRYFDAGAHESLYIKSWMIGSGKGDKGDEYGLRVWP
ncbi:MAG: hypothetical protein KAI66_20465, partial [Lentisphaeria bacterium]|nr:hypothetical protein [Lentisphaeria bacterium]